MNQLPPTPKIDLNLAIAEFVGALEVVLHYDWDYTTLMISGEEPSFLQPELTPEEENEDWGSRGAFLEKYRELVLAMRSNGIAPIFPFPLDRISPDHPEPPTIWSGT